MNQVNQKLKVGIIATTSRKADIAMPVAELFSVSPLFRYSLAYCQKHYDLTYVLSSNHGLLAPNTKIEPESDNPEQKQRDEFKEWLKGEVEDFKSKIPQGSTLYFHTGKRLRKLTPLLKGYFECVEPTKGVGIGKQLKNYIQDLGQIKLNK